MIHADEICSQLYALAKDHNGQDVDILLSGVPVLILQRHESVDHVLCASADRYRKNMVWFRQALGASRFSEDGEAWMLRRDLTHSYFTHFDRERACALARCHAEVAVRRMLFDTSGGAATIDDRALRTMAVSVLVENFFNIPFVDTGVDLDHISEMMEYGSAYSFVPAGMTEAMYSEGARRLPALRREVLRELSIFRHGAIPVGPMLAKMLAADADPANDIVLEHELLTFFAAGAETSAATMGWACYLLAKHPAVQEAIRAELSAIDEGEGWNALTGCNVLRNFISEALRLFPPTPIIARRALQADRIDDRDILPDQNILISFIGIGHDRRVRSDPWSLGALDTRLGSHSGINTAFGAGPRICGGKHFALVELMAFLDVFLRQARFVLSSNDPPRFHWKAQMLREGGQPVRVVKHQRPSGGTLDSRRCVQG